MVVIVTDSSVDLPPAEAERLGIVVAPLSVAFSDENLHDRGLSRAEFYRRLEAAPRPPLVSGAAAEAFAAAFRQAQPRGEIVCMVMSVESSFTYVAAEVAVREVPGLAISIINTGRSLAAQAAIAIAAAEAAQAGAERAAVVSLIEEISSAADTYLAPATTEYLRRADRLTTLGQGPAGRLDGAIPVLRVRGRLTAVAKAPDAETARRQMLELAVKAVSPGEEQIAIVTHAVAPEAAAAVAEQLAERLRCRPPLITELGPTVGALLGPGTVGIGFCPSRAAAGS
ncbi:MAG TPA: DegV family protein [Dehalococcoidia bacterium]|nr:DegV family protein [Dehalococcoidia bacterium]